MSSPDDSSLFYLFAPVTTGCSPADAGHWRVYSWRSVLLPAGNEVKNWDRKVELGELYYIVDRTKLGSPLMFSTCLPPTGNCVCNAGRDHRAGHGTLWLRGGPHCGRCRVYVSLNCASLLYFGACASCSWYSKSLRVWGDYLFCFCPVLPIPCTYFIFWSQCTWGV